MRQVVMMLRGYGNPDYGQYADVSDKALAIADDPDDFEEQFREDFIWYRDEYELGGGNCGWQTGAVFDCDHENGIRSYLGRFSHNGRWWPVGSGEAMPAVELCKAGAALDKITRTLADLKIAAAKRDAIIAEMLS